MADTTWGEQLAAQLSWHWDNQLRARLDDLTDAEYLREPVPNSWTIRPGPGGGAWTIDWAFPAPDPPPVTTIAWRLAHLVVGVFGDRNARHFGSEPIGYDTYAFPPHAAASLADLDRQVDTWLTGVRGLTEAQLAQPCGEPGFEEDWTAALVLHIQREAIHHGAEIALLRDLYAHGLR